jgi:hypothetical protein
MNHMITQVKVFHCGVMHGAICETSLRVAPFGTWSQALQSGQTHTHTWKQIEQGLHKEPDKIQSECVGNNAY